MIKPKENDDGIILIPRKLWVALANDQLTRRRRYLGKGFAKPCSTCLEILMCDGPIGKHICSTLDKMQTEGLISGPKKIPFEKVRRKFLPIAIYCLEAYGLVRGKEVKHDKESRD